MKLFLLLLSLCLLPLCSAAASTSDILLGNWQVISQAGITCDQAHCCCFTGIVNGYLAAGENFLNGTSVGTGCRAGRTSQHDNIDAPTSYNWVAEFLSIDNIQFTLSNLTNAGQFGISLLMNTSASPASKSTCGMQLFKQDTNGIPAVVNTNNPTPGPIPIYVNNFIGTWYADQTCTTTDNACCCLTGQVNITASTTQKSFTIAGAPSTGCASSNPILTDDFVWPIDDASSHNGYNATLFSQQDDYTISYTIGTPGKIMLYDNIKPTCSLQFTNQAPTPAPTPTPTPRPNGVSQVMVSGMTLLAMVCALFF